jgi:hypothetical protein
MVLGREFNSRVCLKNLMDKIDQWMAENNENNKGSQKGQVTPKKYF